MTARTQQSNSDTAIITVGYGHPNIYAPFCRYATRDNGASKNAFAGLDQIN